MNSCSACWVASRSAKAPIVAYEMLSASPRNWPFSRVGVSTNASWTEYFAERRIMSQTLSSVALELSNLASPPFGRSVCTTVAEMSRSSIASPASGTSR